MFRFAFRVTHAAIVGLVLIGAAAMSGCGGPRETTPPAELVGVWTTTDSRYQGRFFEFTPSGSMRIGTGDGNVDNYPIWDIEREPEDAFMRYAVTYLNADSEEYTFHFYYESFDGGVIRFIHQDLKWTREKE